MSTYARALPWCHMSYMASQITGRSIVCPTICSGKIKVNSKLLTFVVNTYVTCRFSQKGPVTRMWWCLNCSAQQGWKSCWFWFGLGMLWTVYQYIMENCVGSLPETMLMITTTSPKLQICLLQSAEHRGPCNVFIYMILMDYEQNVVVIRLSYMFFSIQGSIKTSTIWLPIRIVLNKLYWWVFFCFFVTLTFFYLCSCVRLI